MTNNNKKMLILEINGLTEEEIQEEFTGFFQMLDEKYNGYGATVTGVTNRVVAEIKELIK